MVSMRHLCIIATFCAANIAGSFSRPSSPSSFFLRLFSCVFDWFPPMACSETVKAPVAVAAVFERISINQDSPINALSLLSRANALTDCNNQTVWQIAFTGWFF